MDSTDRSQGVAHDPRRHLSLQTAPVDDSGTGTQDRYHYQHHCTARLVFAMLGAPDVTLVVCETHEDAMVFYDDGIVELVSIKHRDDQVLPLGPLREALVGLFRRWQRLGREPRCRLMTNAKPVAGKAKAAGLIEACHDRRPDAWIQKVQTWTESEDAEEVRAFLTGFSADEPTGARQHIGAINLQDLVRPSLAAANLAATDAEVAYERVLGLIARCNRDEPVDGTALLRYLADPERASLTVRAQDRIGRRAIDRQRLHEALLEPVIPKPRAQLSFDDVPRRDESTLERKLVLGGFGPTTVNAAQLLRANWEALETRWRTGAPGGDPAFADLRVRALAAAARAERATHNEAAAYGEAMHEVVERDFTVDGLKHKPQFALTDEHLLGLIYELTDECRVWWSARQEL
ncbi:MAG: sle2 [Conexibacter sp.]|nr:sle2 [Conexibacter sp.]